MLLKKILRYFNIAAAVATALLVALVYWHAWRPLPRTTGQIEAPVSAPATIARDELGVPHITAASIEDALFLQGYVTAQDRLWQMDVLRRLAGGTLAEIFGPAALEADLSARRLRLHKIARQQHADLPEGDRRVLDAYVRGVNYYMSTHAARLPVEFRLLRYEPRPWSGADSLLIGLHMFRALTSTWEIERQKLRLRQAGDPAKVDRLFPLRAGWEPAPGSNAWALSGRWTASGKPLLAGDPHLEYTLPAIWHPVHLRAPGLDVIGAALVGVPCVIIGHNRDIAWSMTNLQFDVQDLYEVRLDASTGLYWYDGRWEQARLETETIPVRGAAPVELKLWVTRHGPVVAREKDRSWALRWTAQDTATFAFPFLDLNRAGNWQQFRAALARFPGPAQNFVYADRQGHIGYQAAGRLPIRRAHGGDLPADGSSPEQEWAGYIPFEALPSAFDPPSGMIVSANQNPFPENFPYPVSGSFAPPYRAAQIRSLLGARSGWRAEEMLSVQTDVYSAFHHLLARATVAACERAGPRDPALAPAIELLARWNGQMEKDSAAAFLAVLLESHFRKAVVERASPGNSLVYRFEIAPAVLEQLLRERPREWFADFDAVLVTALTGALEEGRRMQGSDPRRWRWGQANRLLVSHPVLGRLPLIGKYFRIGPVPMSGAATTVKQTTTRIGPSLRIVVDFADLDRSLFVLPAGVSGHPLSRRFKDQWESYYQGRAYPLGFGRFQAREVLRVRPRARH
ncbi:MAG: penicillin acylase family protein [Bryobacteraceae bacterium]|nr:penicillin acylase family protein [Bryobacteraceae bacterium]